MIRLLPCAFRHQVAGAARSLGTVRISDEHGHGIAVVCNVCKMQGPIAYYRGWYNRAERRACTKARKLWNDRLPHGGTTT